MLTPLLWVMTGTGKFDFLEEEGCKVVYLPRTPEISSTQIKNDLQIKE